MEVLNVKLVKSLIGAKKSQIAVLTSLGLRRIGDVSAQPKNDATMGKIKRVSHLIQLS